MALVANMDMWQISANWENGGQWGLGYLHLCRFVGAACGIDISSESVCNKVRTLGKHLCLQDQLCMVVNQCTGQDSNPSFELHLFFSPAPPLPVWQLLVWNRNQEKGLYNSCCRKTNWAGGEVHIYLMLEHAQWNICWKTREALIQWSY